jgi:HCOMODA/2-hydroxy-3-carboxy-muconic semialdehyde decarboxylase
MTTPSEKMGKETSPGSSASLMEATCSSELLLDLVTANRILCDQKVVDAFGHVSARHDRYPDRFLLARNMAPALVETGDIMEFDLDGNPLMANGPSIYVERFIHAEIYRARPDVHAVVHSHSPSIIPFTVSPDTPLRPLWHVSAFLGLGGDVGVPVFEIRAFAGLATDMLVRNSRLGAALAETLANGPIVLMRGHGSTSVGSDLRQAVYRAVYAEVNARLQAEAIRLGTITFLTEGESVNASAANDTQLNRVWDFWKMKAYGSL